jgi:UDP-GlcNAc:undecaprenyl-phosphate GlcNAc-1-phosphate transferase
MAEEGLSCWGIAGITVFFLLLTLWLNSFLISRIKGLGSATPKGKVFERWNARSKPAIGGIGLYVAFLGAIAFFLALGLHSDLTAEQLTGIFVAASLAFFSGLADDAWHISPRSKLLSQITCAIILIATGTFIDTGIPFFSWILSIFWIVALMNSLNMLDNMDGITGLVSAVILAAIIWYSKEYFDTAPLELLALIAIVGAILGFLRFNLHPSSIYMGDSGSQFLGLLLAVAAMVFVWHRPLPIVGDFSIWHFLQVALLFLLPAADTILVTFNRIRYGRSPFQGGRDHSTHHFSYLGLKDSSIAWLYLMLASLNALLALSLPLFITNGYYFGGVILLAYILVVVLFMFLLARRNIKKGLYTY